MGVTTDSEELRNSDQASFSLDKQQHRGDAVRRSLQVGTVPIEMTCSLPLPVQDGGSDAILSGVSPRMKEPRCCPTARCGEPAMGQGGSPVCRAAHEPQRSPTAPAQYVPDSRKKANWECIPFSSHCAGAC